jgi:hypothetical protein
MYYYRVHTLHAIPTPILESRIWNPTWSTYTAGNITVYPLMESRIWRYYMVHTLHAIVLHRFVDYYMNHLYTMLNFDMEGRVKALPWKVEESISSHHNICQHGKATPSLTVPHPMVSSSIIFTYIVKQNVGQIMHSRFCDTALHHLG